MTKVKGPDGRPMLAGPVREEVQQAYAEALRRKIQFDNLVNRKIPALDSSQTFRMLQGVDTGLTGGMSSLSQEQQTMRPQYGPTVERAEALAREAAQQAANREMMSGLGDMENQVLSGDKAYVKMGPYTMEQAKARQLWALSHEPPSVDGTPINDLEWSVYTNETVGLHYPKGTQSKMMMEKIRSNNPDEAAVAARYGLELAQRYPEHFEKRPEEYKAYVRGYFMPSNTPLPERKNFDLSEIQAKPLSWIEKTQKHNKARENVAAFYEGEYTHKGFSDYFVNATRYGSEYLLRNNPEDAGRHAAGVRRFLGPVVRPHPSYDSTMSAMVSQGFGGAGAGIGVAAGGAMLGQPYLGTAASIALSGMSQGGAVRESGGSSSQAHLTTALSLGSSVFLGNPAFGKVMTQTARQGFERLSKGFSPTASQQKAIADTMKQVTPSTFKKRAVEAMGNAVPKAEQIADTAFQSMLNYVMTQPGQSDRRED